jgi:transcriptional regulator with XRE-family HTH domain
MSTKSAHPTDHHVGRQVRIRRMSLGLSQTDLGGAVGVSFQQIQKYEKGTNRIGASRLQHIAQILQVSVPFFFEGLPRASHASNEEGAAPPLTYVADFLATSEGLELIKFFVQIKTPQVRRCIVHLVEQIADFKQDAHDTHPTERRARRGRPLRS